MGAASETERRSGGRARLAATLRPAHIQTHHEDREYVGQEELLDLARAAGVDARTKVLDLCCGSGGPALHLAQQKGCQIVGVDRSSEAIYLAPTSTERQELDRRATFIVSDALCPPIDSAFFDAVLLYLSARRVRKLAVVAQRLY